MFKVGDLVEIKHNHHRIHFGIVVSPGKFHLEKWYDVYDIEEMKTGLHCENELREPDVNLYYWR